MKLEVVNITKDKFEKVQEEILRVLINNGFKGVDTVTIKDALSHEFKGYEFRIKTDKRNRPAITSSSVCG